MFDNIFNCTDFKIYMIYWYEFDFKSIYSIGNYYERNSIELYNIINTEKYFEIWYKYNNFNMKYNNKTKAEIKDKYFKFIKDKIFVCDNYVQHLWDSDCDDYIIYKIKGDNNE